MKSVTHIYIWEKHPGVHIEVGTIYDTNDAEAIQRIKNIVIARGGRLLEIYKIAGRVFPP